MPCIRGMTYGKKYQYKKLEIISKILRHFINCNCSFLLPLAANNVVAPDQLWLQRSLCFICNIHSVCLPQAFCVQQGDLEPCIFDFFLHKDFIWILYCRIRIYIHERHSQPEHKRGDSYFPFILRVLCQLRRIKSSKGMGRICFADRNGENLLLKCSWSRSGNKHERIISNESFGLEGGFAFCWNAWEIP